MNLGTAQVIQGNALALPLPDNSVDLICSSPPYWSLRSYQDAGQHYEGQLGSEPTPQEFVNNLIAATAEMVRVLKPTGSIFINLGDKYVSTPPGNERSLNNSAEHQRKGKESYDRAWRLPPGMKQKSLMGLPWRYAIRCIDELGLILRAEIIWNKPNGLPESVTDRVRRSHEQWFHMTVSPRYYSAVDEIREAHITSDALTRIRSSSYDNPMSGAMNGAANPLGKLPGSVWTVPTQPLTVPPELGVDHFAAYPMEWPRRIITGWTPNGICTLCGEGRRPVANAEYRPNPKGGYIAFRPDHEELENYSPARPQSLLRSTTITGYMCACPTPTAPTTPSVVVDPFGGTGTTALVAKALGRIGITIDLSSDYCRLAEWRVNDPRELAAALQVEKPEPVHPDQLDLFSEAP